MTEYYVTKGYPVPIKVSDRGCRKIAQDKLKQFWEKIPEKDKRGCYIFALKVAKGFTPYYVGQAAKQSFQAECFTYHKLSCHYDDVLHEEKGTPYLFLVVQKKEKGKWSVSTINDVEEHLIAYAASKNPNLTNKRRLPNQKWSIKGVIAANSGKPSKEAVVFKKLIGIKQRSAV